MIFKFSQRRAGIAILNRKRNLGIVGLRDRFAVYAVVIVKLIKGRCSFFINHNIIDIFKFYIDLNEIICNLIKMNGQQQKSIKSSTISPSFEFQNQFISYDLLVNEIDKQLQCKICLNLVIFPETCQFCFQNFCTSCVASHFELSATCPICGNSKNFKKSNSEVIGKLSRVNLKCQNSGCVEVIAYADYFHHLDDCTKRLVECNSKDCRTRVYFEDLENHMLNEC